MTEVQTYQTVKFLAPMPSPDFSVLPYHPKHDNARHPVLPALRAKVPINRIVPSERAIVRRRRAVCKGCSRRRKVEHNSLLCSECVTGRPAKSKAKVQPSPKAEPLSPPASIDETSSEICRMQSPATRQSQMLSTFIQHHWESVSTNEALLSYIEVLASTTWSSPILSAAIDTMLYAYFGSIEKDPRLSKLSQESYAQTISMLVPAMTPGKLASSPYSSRDVITSILLIRLYDNGRPHEKEVQESHFMHLYGAVKYLQARGTTSLDPSQLLDRKLFEQLHLQSLLACIAYRKACPWSQPEWAEAQVYAAPARSQESWKSKWFSHLVILPGLLERADTLQRLAPSSSRQQELLSICRQLVAFRDRLLASNADDMALQPETIDVADLDAWNLDIEEHCFISSSTTFTTFYKFTKREIPFRCAISWLHCILADCTLLRILHANPELSNHPSPTSAPSTTSTNQLHIPTITASAYRSATALCRCIPFYAASTDLSIINWLLVVMTCVQSLFEEQGAVKEIGWCQAVIIAAQLRRARVQATSRPNLCRVADLTVPLAEAARYLPGHFL